jgi:hypothetical protein
MRPLCAHTRRASIKEKSRARASISRRPRSQRSCRDWMRALRLEISNWMTPTAISF